MRNLTLRNLLELINISWFSEIVWWFYIHYFRIYLLFRATLICLKYFINIVTLCWIELSFNWCIFDFLKLQFLLFLSKCLSFKNKLMIEVIYLLLTFYLALCLIAYLALFIHIVYFRLGRLPICEHIMHFFYPWWNFRVKRISKLLIYITLHHTPPAFILFLLGMLLSPVWKFSAKTDHEFSYLLFNSC